jgi:hypothetical protein
MLNQMTKNISVTLQHMSFKKSTLKMFSPFLGLRVSSLILNSELQSFTSKFKLKIEINMQRHPNFDTLMVRYAFRKHFI